MAYSFASASNQHLTASAPVADVPVTMTALVRTTSTATAQAIVGVANKSNNDRHVLAINLLSAVAKVQAFSAPVGALAAASGDYLTDVWFQAAGVWSALNSRAAYRDGANKGTDSANQSAITAGELAVGARYNGSYGVFLNGQAAEVAVWSVDLTDAEIASLGKGFKPYRIRPQSLVFYAPLIRNIQDTKGGRTITNNNGATVAAHPRVI